VLGRIRSPLKSEAMNVPRAVDGGLLSLVADWLCMGTDARNVAHLTGGGAALMSPPLPMVAPGTLRHLLPVSRNWH